MPSFNNVSYNSSRVQRAYRINKLETIKLNHTIQLLEKERLHRQRLTNQDIRTVTLTLDYIHTCSGHSPEALAPGSEYKYDDENMADKGPCFLYGERIVSRKKRRTLRPQSAMDKALTGSRSQSETQSIASSSDTTPRPQSSPSRRTTFVTHFNRDREETESLTGAHSETSRSECAAANERFKPAWVEGPMPDVTKVLLRANSIDETPRRNSIFDREKDLHNGGSVVLKALTRNLRIQSQSQGDSAIEKEFANSERRGSRMSDSKRGSLVLSAGAMKSQLTQIKGLTSDTKEQKPKKAINIDKPPSGIKRVSKYAKDSSLL